MQLSRATGLRARTSDKHVRPGAPQFQRLTVVRPATVSGTQSVRQAAEAKTVASAPAATESLSQRVGSLMGTLTSRRAEPVGNVVVLGAQGASAARLAKALLEAGYKVTAGIDYPEQAKATLAFVKKYELLNKAALNNLKLAEDDAPLPKGARVVIVDDDELGPGRTDARFLERALDRANNADAAQVVVVSPAATGSGSFFSFGLGPSPSQPNKALTKTEQLVAKYGIPYTVLRLNISDLAEEFTPCVVRAGPGALTPAKDPISADTAASVLAGVLASPVPPAGLACVLEVGAVEREEADVDVRLAVVAAVQELIGRNPVLKTPERLPKKEVQPPKQEKPVAVARRSASPVAPAVRAGTANVREATPAAQAAKPAGGLSLPSFLTLGTVRISSKDEKREATPARAKVGPSATRVVSSPSPSTRRTVSPEPPARAIPKPAPKPAPKPVAKPAPVVAKRPPPARSSRSAQDSDDEEDAPRGFFASLFGGARPVSVDTTAPAAKGPSSRAAPARPAAKPVPVKPVPVKPTPVRAAPVRAASPPPRPAPRSAPTVATVKRGVTVEPSAESKRPQGIFGFFAVAPQSPTAGKEAPAKPAAKAAPAKPAPPTPKAVARPAPAARPAARSSRTPEPEPEQKKAGGGILGFLFGGPKDDSDEDEAPVRGKPAAKPAPARPVSASAKASGSSFTSVRKVAPPESAKPAPKPQPKAAPPRSAPSSAPTAPAQGTYKLRGTYKPVSGYTVTPKPGQK